MRIGLLGTGNVARALAPAWAAKGHDVVLGSRKPDARQEDLAELGLPVLGLDDTAAYADVLVNATPGTDSISVLEGIGARALTGKALLDVGIGLTAGPGLAHPDRSLGELIQQAFPQTPVVKTLCTMDAATMVTPDALTGPSTVFLSGDDADAKRLTAALLADLGWPESSQLDLGGIETARGQEHFALLFLGIAEALGDYGFNIEVVRRAETRVRQGV